MAVHICCWYVQLVGLNGEYIVWLTRIVVDEGSTRPEYTHQFRVRTSPKTTYGTPSPAFFTSKTYSSTDLPPPSSTHPRPASTYTFLAVTDFWKDGNFSYPADVVADVELELCTIMQVSDAFWICGCCRAFPFRNAHSIGSVGIVSMTRLFGFQLFRVPQTTLSHMANSMCYMDNGRHTGSKRRSDWERCVCRSGVVCGSGYILVCKRNLTRFLIVAAKFIRHGNRPTGYLGRR